MFRVGCRVGAKKPDERGIIAVMPPPIRRHRRDFLRGKAAADALAGLIDSTAEDRPLGGLSAGPSSAAYLVRVGRRAMACQFEVLLNAGQYADGLPAALAALDLVEQLEAQLTVYRDDSEVMDLNRRAASGAIPVESGLFSLLRQSIELHQATAGAFDITSGPLTKAWGFYRRQGAIPPADDLRLALSRVGSDKLALDEAARTIRFNVPGVEINLGAIGKGYALDRCAERLVAAGIDDFLLHGGTSSVLARGAQAGQSPPIQHPTEPPIVGWRVAILDPLRPGHTLAHISLRNRAIGTSGSRVQFFRHAGRRYGHILDPRTGWPAEGVLSATVIAPTAAEADALSTAFYIMGPEAATTFCEGHPDIAAVLLTLSPDDQRVELHVAGLSAGEVEWVSPYH
jgi:thiamine biosynthesis lipoprotein